MQAGTYLDPADDATLISALPKEATSDECAVAPVLAVAYFCSYLLLCGFLLLQLVIAIVLDNIQNQYAMEEAVIRCVGFCNRRPFLKPFIWGYLGGSLLLVVVGCSKSCSRCTMDPGILVFGFRTGAWLPADMDERRSSALVRSSFVTAPAPLLYHALPTRRPCHQRCCCYYCHAQIFTDTITAVVCMSSIPLFVPLSPQVGARVCICGDLGGS